MEDGLSVDLGVDEELWVDLGEEGGLYLGWVGLLFALLHCEPKKNVGDARDVAGDLRGSIGLREVAGPFDPSDTVTIRRSVFSTNCSELIGPAAPETKVWINLQGV